MGQKLISVLPAKSLRLKSTSVSALKRCLVIAGIAYLAPLGTLQAQETWHGLNVPRFANITDYTESKDSDEYEMYFRSAQNTKAVFDFYRDYLVNQGFQVTNSKTKKAGFKADLMRGKGGPDDTVELDVKLENGRYKVEIEFDD